MQALHAILKFTMRSNVPGWSGAPRARPRDRLWHLAAGQRGYFTAADVLKAGYSSRARATKDLDLAVANGVADGSSIRDLLIDALSEDPDGEPLGNLGSTS